MAKIFTDAKGRKQNIDEIRKGYKRIRAEADINIITNEVEGYYLRGEGNYCGCLEIPIDQQTYEVLLCEFPNYMNC